jgi:hypothetical protein
VVVVAMMVVRVVAFLGVGTVVREVAGSDPVRGLALQRVLGHGVTLVLVAGLAHR